MRHWSKTLSMLSALCLIGMLHCMPARSAASPQTASTDQSPPAKRNDKSKPAPDIVEKRRFVDLAKLQGEEQQLIGIPVKKRAEIIMPGDQLEITLLEKLPVSQEKRIEIKRIDDDGTIVLYPLGRLTIAGTTLSQARTLIEQKMGNYIVSPLCELTIVKKAYEPKVFVFGEAVKPGTFPLSGGERLLDILSFAGGPTQRAYKASVKLVRLYGDSVGVMSIDLNDLLKRGYIENNLPMQDQDIVFIPTRLFSSATEVLKTLADVLPWYYFVKNF